MEVFMKERLVSVVMATYNEELDWIKDSIDSILNQTYQNIEFIIVNDNPDNKDIIKFLLDYSEMDNRIKLIFNDENIGLVKSLNKALNISIGEFIIRMDADDISELDRIEKQINILINKNIDIVMSNAVVIDENNNLTNTYLQTPAYMKDIKQFLKYKNVCIHPTWAFKKNILNDLLEYNECKYVEDYDFICRAIIKGYTVECIQENLLKYRIRSTSVCNSNRLNQQINFQIVNNRYKAALKFNESIFKDKEIYLNEQEYAEIQQYENKLEISRKLIEEKKILKGKMVFYTNFLKNKYKRRQLLNEVMYIINKYRLNIFIK